MNVLPGLPHYQQLDFGIVGFGGRAGTRRGGTVAQKEARRRPSTECIRSARRLAEHRALTLERDPWKGTQCGPSTLTLPSRSGTALNVSQQKHYLTETIGPPLLSDIRLPYTDTPRCLEFRPRHVPKMMEPPPKRLDHSMPQDGAFGPLPIGSLREPYVEMGKLERLRKLPPTAWEVRIMEARRRKQMKDVAEAGMLAGRLDEATLESLRARMRAEAAGFGGGSGKQLEKLFRCLDADNSGSLGFDELREAVRFVLRISVRDFSEGDIAALFLELDADGSGGVDISELMDFVGSGEKPAENVQATDAAGESGAGRPETGQSDYTAQTGSASAEGGEGGCAVASRPQSSAISDV